MSTISIAADFGHTIQEQYIYTSTAVLNMCNGIMQ